MTAIKVEVWQHQDGSLELATPGTEAVAALEERPGVILLGTVALNLIRDLDDLGPQE